MLHLMAAVEYYQLLDWSCLIHLFASSQDFSEGKVMWQYIRTVNRWASVNPICFLNQMFLSDCYNYACPVSDKIKIVLFEYFIAFISILQYMVNWLKLF